MDTVHVEMAQTAGRVHGVNVVTESTDGVRTGVSAVPTDEWARLRAEVVRHYKLEESTRVDCINIITSLTVALTDR